MAGIINEIRSRAWLVIGIIGLSMVIFIFTGLINQYGNRLGLRDSTVGRVGDDKIEYSEFYELYQQNLNAAQQNGTTVTDAQRQQLLDNLWQTKVNQLLLGKEIKRYELDVPGTESYRLFVGPNPSPVILQIPQFRDPKTNEFDPQRVKYLLDQSKRDENLRLQLEQLENQVIENRIQEQYFGLLQRCIFVSRPEAKQRLLQEGKTVSFQYLAINYASLPDSAVAPSEDDFLTYYEENKNRFKLENPETVIKYVVFPKQPSSADSAKARTALLQLQDEFRTSVEDTAIALHETEVSEPSVFMAYSSLPASYRDKFPAPKAGQLVGPFQDGNAYKLVKVVATRADSLPSFKLRQVLIRPKGFTPSDSARARLLADSVARVASPANFRQLALNLSDDNQSRFSGGELGWYSRGTYGPTFDLALKKLAKNTFSSPILSPRGYHVVQVEDRLDDQVRLAVITKEISASTGTLAEQQRKAAQLGSEVTSAAEFDTQAVQKHYDVRTSAPITPTSATIPGITGAGELVRWALTSKKGELSGIKETESAFVVAYISERKDGEYQPLEDVKQQIQPEVVNRKRAKLIIAKLGDQPPADLEAARKAYGAGAYVNQVKAFSLGSASIPGIGNDPILLGRISSLKLGEVTHPIRATSGVYILKGLEVKEPTQQELAASRVEQLQQSLLTQRRNQLMSRLFNGMKDHAQVKDNRYKFSF